MTNYKPFEEYLMSVHSAQYYGTDDDMPDAYEKWLSELDTDEIIEMAEACIEKRRLLKN